MLDSFKTSDGYLLVAIDGVTTYSTKRPIEHSTFCTHENLPTTYHQKFVEAKIIGQGNFALSLDCEPIENPTGEFDKQDCEITAAIRLMIRIAKRFPFLKFYFLGDALYCNSGFISICREKKWGHAFSAKESKNPALMQKIRETIANKPQHTRIIFRRVNSRKKLKIVIRWCNAISHNFDGTCTVDNIHYIEAEVFLITDNGERRITKFAYITSSSIDQQNAEEVFMTCRKRWKIENVGFNFQKNNALNISHSYSAIGHAGHNYYQIAQIAHIIMQMAALTDLAKSIATAKQKTTDQEDDSKQEQNKKKPEKPARFGSLLNMVGTFRRIFEKIQCELFEKPIKLYKFSDLRVRLPL